jgi:hypothetical protein
LPFGDIDKELRYTDEVVEVVDDVVKYGDEAEQVVEKTYQTYTKKNEVTGEIYSGRTSSKVTPYENIAARDKKHHMNEKGFGPLN